MPGRSAAFFGLFEQGSVVLLCGLERIGAYDAAAWVVASAESPCSGARRVVANDGIDADSGAVGPTRSSPLLLQADRAVAAKVPGIAPKGPIFVEIRAGEQ